MDPIQKYTDLTYGVLLLLGLLSTAIFSTGLAIGFGVGVFLGYGVHVGSKMFEHRRHMDAIEDVKEKSEETVEKVEETQEKVEETQEAVEKVEEHTERVEDAMNGE